MLHGIVWDTPSASSKKEVSFKPETELGYVTSNCTGRAVRQFEEEASLRLGTEVEYVAWNSRYKSRTGSTRTASPDRINSDRLGPTRIECKNKNKIKLDSDQLGS